MLTLAQAKKQLVSGARYVPMLTAAAKRHGVQPALALAIASRETNLRNVIGDGGHGVGVIQIDIRYHSIAREAIASRSWATDPAPLIDYGVRLLASNYAKAAQAYPQHRGGEHKRGWMKIACAAYNAGWGDPDGTGRGAHGGIRQYGDADHYTTGQDYGRDVLQRMDLFTLLLAPKPPRP